MSASTPVPTVKLQTFHAACWLLGLVAFLELGAVGLALALQDRQVAEPRVIERVEYVTLEPAPGVGTVRGGPAEPPPAELPPAEMRPLVPVPVSPARESTPVPVLSPAPLKTPPIADPIVARLVEEAREARVAGDMRRAIVKLEEAEKQAPDEPNTLYQFGQVFEGMGVYDRATDYYQSVFELGTAGAGSLYQLAANKIAHGFVAVNQMRGKLALGRIRQFEDPRVRDGQKVVITVPVLAAPDEELDPGKVEVVVSCFDKLEGEIVPAAKPNEPSTRWITEPVDWKDATGEELLQVTYFIPKGDVQELHLFGQREYFGQLVELNYSKNGEMELLDSVAWPRILARRMNVAEHDMLILPDEFIPEDINPENPLLPALPEW